MGYHLAAKTAGAYSWQPYHLHVPIIYKSLEPQPPGALGPVQGLLYLYSNTHIDCGCNIPGYKGTAAALHSVRVKVVATKLNNPQLLKNPPILTATRHQIRTSWCKRKDISGADK